MTQAMLGQLSGPLLPSLLANAPALATGSSGATARRLQEQQQDGGRKHALAGRFHQLRADRVALRGRLRHARARNHTTGAAPASRHLLQEGVAAAGPAAAPPAALAEQLPLLVQQLGGNGDAAAYWDAAAAYQQGYADGMADVYLQESGQLWAGGEDAADAPLWPKVEQAAPGDVLLIMQVGGSVLLASQLVVVCGMPSCCCPRGLPAPAGGHCLDKLPDSLSAVRAPTLRSAAPVPPAHARPRAPVPPAGP